MSGPSRDLASHLGVLLAVAFAAACSDADPAAVREDPVATHIEIVDRDLTLFIPASKTLVSVVRDQWGAVMTAPVTYASRDSSTARVEGGTTLVAVAPGETRLVATAGRAVDSTSVVVRYEVLSGEARVRIRSTKGMDMVRGWKTASVFVDPLGVDTDNHFLMVAADAQGDTGIVMMLPSLPSTGTKDVKSIEVQALLDAADIEDLAEFSYFIMATAGNSFDLYASVAGTRLVVDGVVAATQYGGQGLIRGRLVFRGLGYRVVEPANGGSPQVSPLGDTLTVHADLATPYHWIPEGRGSYTITGGPAASSASGVEAYWSASSGGTGEIVMERGDVSVEILLERPSAGTFQLRAADPSGYPRYRPTVEVAKWGSSTYSLGRVVSGTLTLTEVRAAVGGTWGVLRGSVDALMSFTSGWSGTPVSATLTASFHVPVEPEESWAGPSPRAERPGRSRLPALLRPASVR